MSVCIMGVLAPLHGQTAKLSENEKLKDSISSSEDLTKQGDYYYNQDDQLEKAVSFYQRAADQGDIQGMLKLARCYLDGTGVRVNEEIAFKYYEMAAKLGSKDGIFWLGICYRTGLGVEENFKKGEELLQKAADKGCLLARGFRELFALENLAETQNPQIAISQLNKSLNCFRVLADKGDRDAQGVLGMFCLLGLSDESPVIDTASWLLKAAQQNEVTSQYLLGILYLQGYTVDTNEKEGQKWLVKAADRGHEFARGFCHLVGIGSYRNKQHAVHWLEQAAKHKNQTADAQYLLGACYLNGIGVSKNNEEAFRYFKLAAENEDPLDGLLGGIAYAQSMLANCYLNGIGTEQNLQNAFKWYLALAENGSHIGQLHVGLCYLKGFGTTQNAEQGVRYLTESASNGNPQAQFFLAECLLTGNGIPPNPTSAAELMREIAELNPQDFAGFENVISSAQHRMGELYQQGVGVPKSTEEALKWFAKASTSGSVEAGEMAKTIKEEERQQKTNDEQSSKIKEKLIYGGIGIGLVILEEVIRNCITD